MGALPLWSAQDVQCPTVAKTLALREVSKSRPSLELSQGSLGWVEVTRGIAMRSNSRNQPGGLSLLRLLAPSAQFPYNVPHSQGGDMRRLVSQPAYYSKKNLILGFRWLLRCQWLALAEGSLFSQVVSHFWMSFFLWLGMLGAAACGNQKPPPLRWGARSVPPGLLFILWRF